MKSTNKESKMNSIDRAWRIYLLYLSATQKQIEKITDNWKTQVTDPTILINLYLFTLKCHQCFERQINLNTYNAVCYESVKFEQ